MIKSIRYYTLLPTYLCVISLCILITLAINRTATVLSVMNPFSNHRVVVIDAGHGGVDGGATSCTGILESELNLEIALRLNDLLHLLGIETKMIRTTDTSIHTEGNTIASQKISDLKNRVKIVNEMPNSLLISIHQNTFTSSQYGGAQVFYSRTDGSKDLAEILQLNFQSTINPESKRKCKQGSGIYLLDKIKNCGVLVECGFISNPEEEAKLRQKTYQNKICCIIASSLSLYYNT